jgi:hypothetical protein
MHSRIADAALARLADPVLKPSKAGARHMADAEVVKYNKAVEKLCVDCAGEVGKLLLSSKRTIITRLGKLTSDITRLPVPDMPAAELGKVPDQVADILIRAGSAYAGVLILDAMLRVDGSGKKLAPAGAGVSGALALV